MPNLNNYELETFKKILQQYTGFNFPIGLEQEFSFRLERVLKQQGYNLSDLLIQLLQHPADPPAVVKILDFLLPDILIGETYFWREPDTFEALTNQILPEIIAHKSAFSRLLRVWSAACSTGEEVYSLSIILKHYFKNSDWSWSVMGSDLNEKALEVARRGEYNEYSFRTQLGKYPHCFEPTNDARRWRVKDTYRTGLRFQQINLATNAYPFPNNDTFNYDLIFCRNVLIYFSPELSQQVIDRLYASLNYGGYLVVSPCEYSIQLFKQFENIQVGSVTFYRRPLRLWAFHEPGQAVSVTLPEPSIEVTPALKTEAVVAGGFDQLIEQAVLALNQKRSADALRWCQAAIKVDVLRAESYLLLTGIYQETGKLETALEMARKFIYLEPERPEGHFYVASLQQALGRNQRATQAYKRLLIVLDDYKADIEVINLTHYDLQQLALENLKLLKGASESKR